MWFENVLGEACVAYCVVEILFERGGLPWGCDALETEVMPIRISLHSASICHNDVMVPVLFDEFLLQALCVPCVREMRGVMRHIEPFEE